MNVRIREKKTKRLEHTTTLDERQKKGKENHPRSITTRVARKHTLLVSGIQLVIRASIVDPVPIQRIDITMNSYHT